MKQLVVFGEDWGAHPSSTQHLIRQLLPEWRTLWLNSIGLRRPQLCMADLQRLWHKLRGPHASVATPLPQGLEVVQPRVIPVPASGAARRLNQYLLQHLIRPRLRAPEPALLWLSLPTAVDAVGTLGERAVIYYCGDDFRALSGVDHDPVAARERELAARADLIITASDTLAERFPAHKTRVLPHGVDYALFSQAKPRPLDLPPGGRPIAGFYGSLSPWIDLEALSGVARRLPDWDLVLIGQASVDLSPLLQFKNVHWLGPRPHHALPAYAQHWQVSLLPFLDNAQIRACNPLKLREYLAAGSPIASTDFPSLNGYRHLISVARGEHLSEAILHAHQHQRGEALRLQRQQRVAGESWQQRAQQVHGWLDALL